MLNNNINHSGRSRENSLDIIRGFAVFTMVAANMAAYGLMEPHPFLFRIYGSFAAPFFISLSGYLLEKKILSGGTNPGIIINRTLFIFGAAIFIDVLIWGILPFTTMDVLYLIGLSFPIIYLLKSLPPFAKILTSIVIFFISGTIRELMGYTIYPSEFSLSGEISMPVPDQTSVLNHWLVDGWFPVFPWLGFSLLGAGTAGLRVLGAKGKIFMQQIGFLFLIPGLIIWYFFPGPMLVRSGYTELFYPAGLGFLFTSGGLIFLSFHLAGFFPDLKINFISVLGESSLFMYVFHLAIISFVIQPFFSGQSIELFLLTYLLLIIIMIGLGYWLKFFKRKYLNPPLLIKFLIGG